MLEYILKQIIIVANRVKHNFVVKGDPISRITDPSKGPCSAQVHGARPQAVQVDGGQQDV